MRMCLFVLYIERIEECFSKTQSVYFWSNWVQHTVLMLIVSISICWLLSKTHSPTHTPKYKLTPPWTQPSPHPLTSIQTSLTHPQTHQHSHTHHHHHHPALTHRHTMATMKTSVFCCCCCFFFSKNPLSLIHSPCIWTGTNLDRVTFGKLTGFHGIHFVSSLGFIIFLSLDINSHF